jgi:hypothetical protein
MENTVNKELPSWVERIDNCCKGKKEESKRCNKRGEYIANIIFNLIFLWIVNKIPDWDLPFIRDNYTVVLWVLNMSILVQIGSNILQLVAGVAGVRYFSRMVAEAAGFITGMVLFYIYPFDFSHLQGFSWLDWFLPIALIIGMAVAALKVFANLWKLLFYRR